MFQNKIFKLPSIIDRVDLSQIVTAKVAILRGKDVIELTFKGGSTAYTSSFSNEVQAELDLEALYQALERYHEPYNSMLVIPNTSDTVDISKVATVSQWENSNGEKWLRIYFNVPSMCIETYKSKNADEVRANLLLVREKMAEYNRYLNNR